MAFDCIQKQIFQELYTYTLIMLITGKYQECSHAKCTQLSTDTMGIQVVEDLKFDVSNHYWLEMNGILLFFRSKMDQGPFCFMKVKATQFQISLPLLPLIQCTYKEESFVKKLSSIQVILDIRSFEANSISIPTYEKANLLEWKPIFL